MKYSYRSVTYGNVWLFIGLMTLVAASHEAEYKETQEEFWLITGGENSYEY